MEAIKTINLTKKYKDNIAVDNLNLIVNKGELFSLLGIKLKKQVLYFIIYFYHKFMPFNPHL